MGSDDKKPEHSLFFRYLTWFALSIFLGLLPFGASFGVLPPSRSFGAIFWHGDAFIFVNTLMAASITDLILSRHAPQRAKALLITASGLVIVFGIFLFMVAAGNEAAITAGEKSTPFDRFSDNAIATWSYVLLPVVVLLSAASVYTTGRGSIAGESEVAEVIDEEQKEGNP